MGDLGVQYLVDALRTAFSNEGYDVIVVRSLELAIEELAAEQIDAVIIIPPLRRGKNDQTDMNGLALAAELPRDKLKVVIEDYYQANFDFISHPNTVLLYKPVDSSRVLDIVRRSIYGPRDLITISLIDLQGETPHKLTPKYLSTIVGSFLNAVADLQSSVNRISSSEVREVCITSISQKSPISVSLEGAAEAVEVIRDIMIPWRRKHAQTVANLEEQEKLAQIANLNAEVQEKRAHAQKDRVESRNAESETVLLRARAEIERIKLENDKVRLENIELALKIIDRYAPELSQTQRIAFVIQLLEPLGVITNSPLDVLRIDNTTNTLQE
jgi:hypothetical protein